MVWSFEKERRLEIGRGEGSLHKKKRGKERDGLYFHPDPDPTGYGHCTRIQVNSEGFPCGSISSLGALGEGPGWDLSVCPAAPPPAPAASGDLGFCPLGIEVENKVFERLGS